MQAALKPGRVTSREIVRQYLQRIGMYEEHAARGDHREPEGARAGRRARPRARGREDPRAAARHPDRAEGQRPHDVHAHHRRRAGVREPGAALRRDADEEPDRRRRDHHRQDRDERAGQLGRRRADADAGQLQRGRRPGLQPVRPAQGSARGDVRRPPGAADRRIELRHRHRRELLGRQRRQRDVGIDPQPVEPEHAGGDQADRRPHQPLRRDSDHRGSGHRRADGEERRRRRDHVRRAGERVARSQRSGDAAVHAGAGARLHEVPEARRPEGRAHRHPARVVLRRVHAARRAAAGGRTRGRGGRGGAAVAAAG